MIAYTIGHQRLDLLRLQEAAIARFLPNLKHISACWPDSPIRGRAAVEQIVLDYGNRPLWPGVLEAAVEELARHCTDSEALFLEGDIIPLAAARPRPDTVRRWAGRPHVGLLCAIMPVLTAKRDYHPLEWEAAAFGPLQAAGVPAEIAAQCDPACGFELVDREWLHWNGGETPQPAEIAGARASFYKALAPWLGVDCEPDEDFIRAPYHRRGRPVGLVDMRAAICRACDADGLSCWVKAEATTCNQRRAFWADPDESCPLDPPRWKAAGDNKTSHKET